VNHDTLQEHRVDAEAEFIERFPQARDAVVYDFETWADANLGKVYLLATAMVAYRTARVELLPWGKRFRILAIPT